MNGRKRKDSVSWRKSIQGRRAIGILLTFALLIPIGIVFVMPFIVMVSTALKPLNQVFDFPPRLIPETLQWQNFADGWYGYGYVNFTTCTWNSLKITINNIVGNLVSCTLAAYAFARLKARGKNFFFAIVLATMLLPNEALVVPQYILFNKLGWLDTHLPLMVPPWFGWAFFSFLLRAILPDHTGRADRRRQDRRRRARAHLAADIYTAVQTGAGDAGYLRLHRQLEQLLRPAALPAHTGRADAAGLPGAVSGRLWQHRMASDDGCGDHRGHSRLAHLHLRPALLRRRHRHNRRQRLMLMPPHYSACYCLVKGVCSLRCVMEGIPN